MRLQLEETIKSLGTSLLLPASTEWMFAWNQENKKILLEMYDLRPDQKLGQFWKKVYNKKWFCQIDLVFDHFVTLSYLQN